MRPVASPRSRHADEGMLDVAGGHRRARAGLGVVPGSNRPVGRRASVAATVAPGPSHQSLWLAGACVKNGSVKSF